MVRVPVIMAVLLLLGGCASAGSGVHDFSGGFVGVTGSAPSNR